MTGPSLDDGFVPAADILASEQIALGTMIDGRDGRDVDEFLATARPEDYYRPAHQAVAAAAARLTGDGVPVDPTTILGDLRATGDLHAIGGDPGYLLKLQAQSSPGGLYHARRVAADAARRRLHLAGITIQQLADPDTYDRAAYDKARAALDTLPDPAAAADTTPEFADVIGAAILGLEQERARGIPLPWADLAEILTVGPGFHVVGARTSVGKSVAALNIAAHAAIRHDIPTVVFSLEMSADELALRLLAAEARIPARHLGERRMTDEDWTRLQRASKWIKDAPLMIRDEPGVTVPGIRRAIRDLTRTHGRQPGLVIVDYLQLVTPAGRASNREQEVAAISRGFKLLSREFGIPFVVPAQLNRGPESRSDKRPQAADLRESGSLEQDADTITLLYRPDAHDKASERAGEIDLIVAKQRNGPTGTVTAAWQGEYQRIADLAPRWTADQPAA